MNAGGLWRSLTLAGTVATVFLLTSAIWLIGDKEAIEEFFGDFPRVPKELRLSSKFAGGPSMAREPLTGQVAHHDSHGTSR